MACDVLVQIIAANVQTLEARNRARTLEGAAQLRTRMLESLMGEDDFLTALEPRQHGYLGHPVQVAVHERGQHAVVRVLDVGDPIAREIEQDLFAPFKVSPLRNEHNRTGLGLGLRIANRIMLDHRGRLSYHVHAPHVVFTVELPLQPIEGSR